MQAKFRGVIIVGTTIMLAFLSLWFIKSYNIQMLGGIREEVYVSTANSQISNKISTIANEYHVIIAKEIFIAADGKSGENKIVYEKFGNGSLPALFPTASKSQKIGSQNANTYYFIVGNGLNAKKFAELLSHSGNQAHYVSNDWRFNLIYSMSSPQVGYIVLMILLSYISLLFSQYVSELKAIGIKRLSGRSKNDIAFAYFLKDLKFIGTSFVLSLFVSIVVLFWMNIGETSYLETLVITLGGWAIIFAFCGLVASFILHLSIKRQNIALAIKGKAPIKALSVGVIIVQLLSVIVTVLSIANVNESNIQMNLLQSGKQEWAKHQDVEALSMVTQNVTDEKAYERFITDVFNLDSTLLAVNTYNNQSGLPGQNPADANGYFPTQYDDENVLYVNNNFIKQSGIKISPAAMSEISDMKKGQYCLLIPDKLEDQKAQLAKAWQANQDNLNDTKSDSINYTQVVSTYSGNKSIFSYNMLGSNSVSNRSISESPILVVYSPQTFEGKNLNTFIWQFTNWFGNDNVLTSQPGEVLKIANRYHVENLLGSTTNGYYSVNQSIFNMKWERDSLIVALILSIVCSLVLFYLMNKVYLYQRRLEFFIKRLSGKSILAIHKRYLITLLISGVVVVLVVEFIKLPPIILLAPVVYAFLVIAIFVWLLQNEKLENITILKGE